MRTVSLIPAVFALFLSTTASAQVWEEYVNRENFFQVNLPGEPTMTEVPYRTVKGTNLTARVFTAKADPSSITAGTYRVTVIDYSSAQGELGDAIEQARQTILAKGMVKYDDINNLDFHRSRRITVETPNSRILGEILISATNRLYVVEGETPLNVPPAAQFQASLQILNNDGVRIRERTEIAAPPNEIRPVGERANNEEATRVVAAVSGTWRNPAGGTCQATPRLVGPGSIAITNEVSPACSASGSSCVAGVITRTTSRLTTPLAVRGSSICSHRATRKPCFTRRAM